MSEPFIQHIEIGKYTFDVEVKDIWEEGPRFLATSHCGAKATGKGASAKEALLELAESLKKLAQTVQEEALDRATVIENKFNK